MITLLPVSLMLMGSNHLWTILILHLSGNSLKVFWLISQFFHILFLHSHNYLLFSSFFLKKNFLFKVYSPLFHPKYALSSITSFSYKSTLEDLRNLFHWKLYQFLEWLSSYFLLFLAEWLVCCCFIIEEIFLVERLVDKSYASYYCYCY